MTALVFPFGMRLTTWVVLAIFVALAVKRRDSRPISAALVWLLGFEAAFNVSREALGYGAFDDRIAMIALGSFTLAWFTWHGVRPSIPWIWVTAGIWLVWLATGFHVNHHTLIGFSWEAEILNVIAKTLLAVAYLVPLLSTKHLVAGDALSFDRPLDRLSLRTQREDAAR